MTAPSPTSETTSPTRTERRCLIALLVLAGVLRLGVICWKPESLAEDRDLYWGIARNLAAGHGFIHPDIGQPTAYRPPSYPFLLAGIVLLGGGPNTLGVVQICLSVATVWLSWKLGRALKMKTGALLAAAFVAFNPLLIQSTALAMTETLCVFLLTALLWSWFVTRGDGSRSRLWVGVLFGLAALCRPTVWAFAVLAGLISFAVWLASFRSETRRSFGQIARKWWPIALACGLTIAPWVGRNWLVFGTPIVTTTHGGYTLLLGNNDEAYRAEIAKPTREPWDSREFQRSLEEQRRWTKEGTECLTFEEVPASEIERDRWMSQRALIWVHEHPRQFAESCWLRVKRFWNFMPGGSDAGSLPRVVRWGMALFFLAELSLAALGLWRLRRDEWRIWWPLVLLVVSFALVHVVYWSNLRMRAPVEPVLALLAARGFVRRPIEPSA